MSMHPEQEDFSKLTRLLALKRHEQPPPGYFHNFPRDVVARIRAEESSAAGHDLHNISWLKRFWVSLENRPSLAGAFGAAVCGLLLAGLVFSQKSDSGTIASMEPGSMEAASVGGPQISPNPLPVVASLQTPSALLSSTGNVFTPHVAPSLFKQFKELDKPWVLPANYTAPGQN